MGTPDIFISLPPLAAIDLRKLDLKEPVLAPVGFITIYEKVDRELLPVQYYETLMEPRVSTFSSMNCFFSKFIERSTLLNAASPTSNSTWPSSSLNN